MTIASTLIAAIVLTVSRSDSPFEVDEPLPVMLIVSAESHLPAISKLDRVRVVGRDAPETIYALIGDEMVGTQDSFANLATAHAAMLNAYRAQDWETAQSLLIGGAAEYAAFNFCGLQDLFRNRITRLSQLTLNESWDGVFQALDK